MNSQKILPVFFNLAHSSSSKFFYSHEIFNSPKHFFPPVASFWWYILEVLRETYNFRIRIRIFFFFEQQQQPVKKLCKMWSWLYLLQKHPQYFKITYLKTDLYFLYLNYIPLQFWKTIYIHSLHKQYYHCILRDFVKKRSSSK